MAPKAHESNMDVDYVIVYRIPALGEQFTSIHNLR